MSYDWQTNGFVTAEQLAPGSEWMQIPFVRDEPTPAVAYVPAESVSGLGGLGIVDYILARNKAEKQTQHTREQQQAADANLQAQIDALKSHVAAGLNPSPPSVLPGGPAAAPSSRSTLSTLGLVAGGVLVAAMALKAIRG